MPDSFPREVRSRIMASVRQKGTKPEMTVRRALHRLGYRYRLHCGDLPGRPDLVFSSRRKVLFVNGCFWHWHAGCSRARVPSSNPDFWLAKLQRNRRRDAESIADLRDLGWESLTVWECELRDMETTMARIVSFLGPSAHLKPVP